MSILNKIMEAKDQLERTMVSPERVFLTPPNFVEFRREVERVFPFPQTFSDGSNGYWFNGLRVEAGPVNMMLTKTPTPFAHESGPQWPVHREDGRWIPILGLPLEEGINDDR